MQVMDLVSNRGPVSLAETLRVLWRDAKSVDIASAFVSGKGLDSLSPALSAARSAHVRLLVGLYQCFTTPSVLARLLCLQGRSNGRIRVHVSRDRHFHAKVSISHNRRVDKVVIGSSNLTEGGLTGTGEVNAVLALPADSVDAKRASRAFEAEWENSVELSRDRVTRYRRFFAKLDVRRHTPSVPTWVLGRQADDEEPVAQRRQSRRYWRSFISGTLKDETVRLLREVTDWDKKGYGYFSDSNPPFERGDRILLFDFENGWLREVEYMDKVRSPVRTPDGREFVAYVVPTRPTAKRKLTKPAIGVLKRILRQPGILGLQTRRRLSAKDKLALLAFLRTGKHGGKAG